MPKTKPGCTIIGIVCAKAGKREELLRLLQGFVQPTRREAGCIDYHFHVDEQDPNRFMFYENWRHKADLDEHLRKPYLAVLEERGKELLARPVEISYFEMLSERP